MSGEPRALFVCRASPEIGGGHVVRCHALARQLAALGWRPTFQVNPEAPATVPFLAQGLFPILTNGDAGGAALVVVDDYATDAEAERSLRGEAVVLMALDDLADRSHDCDLLLDATPGRTADEYAGRVPDGCRFLLGPNHALVRPEFRLARHRARTRRSVDRVLVAPGQTDPCDLASLAVAAVMRALPQARIDVVLGAAAANLPRVKATAKAHGAGRIAVHVDLDGAAMAERMTAADLAVGAAGGSAWERCVLGLPSLIVTVADNQHDNAAALEHGGAARHVGPVEKLSLDLLAAAVSAMACDESALSGMSRSAAALCDGRGAFRAAAAVVRPRTGRDGAPMTLRAMETGDAETLFAWQRDPDTRRYARNPEPPAWDEHVAWLEARIEDNACLFAMVEQGGRPSGCIRLDQASEGREISIVTAPEARRRGVARAALGLARDLAPEGGIMAYVKPENTASLALFQAAGYRPAGNDYYRQDAGLR